METMQYISCIRFSIQLIIAESVFLIGRPRKQPFGWRLAGGLVLYFILASGWYALLHLVPGIIPGVRVFFWIGLFVLTMGVIQLCFELQPIELLFVGTGGYATEHIGFTLARVLQYLTGGYEERLGVALEMFLFRFLIYVAVSVVIYWVIIRRNREKESFKPHDGRIVLLSLVMLMTAIILSEFYCTASIVEQRTVVSNIICPLYGLSSCVLVLLMEYYVLRENRMKREQEMMEQMLQMATAQQKSSKQAIDIINMKCHDLKHQIRALATVRDDALRSEYVAELQQATDIYDATYHTGCEALDYVLQEKTLLSKEYQVAFSCMVEGETIAFMSPADVYALMGNALDNALECVAKEPVERRIISLHIRQCGQMVMIHLENQCSRQPEFQDGLPVTDKEDKNLHGFGVKSICYIAEKYDGEVLMRAQNGMFLMDILLPRQQA